MYPLPLIWIWIIASINKKLEGGRTFYLTGIPYIYPLALAVRIYVAAQQVVLDAEWLHICNLQRAASTVASVDE